MVLSPFLYGWSCGMPLRTQVHMYVRTYVRKMNGKRVFLLDECFGGRVNCVNTHVRANVKRDIFERKHLGPRGMRLFRCSGVGKHCFR